MAIPQGAPYPITIYQGGIFSEEFQLTEEDEVTPIPLPAGTIGYSEIRTKPGGDLLGSFEVTVTPATGIVNLYMNSDATTELSRSGEYDVFLVDPANPDQDQLFLQGKVTLDKRVTVVP